jgi:ribosomal protein RSM22 (predicted rRNA methylase)
MVGLPEALQAGVDRELAGHRGAALATAAAAISGDYAGGRSSSPDDALWHAAYLATRLPATFAAVSVVLAALPDRVRADVRTMLDLGAGPGTATWAATAQCPALVSAMQVDRSRALLDLAARLTAATPAVDAVVRTQQVADIGGAGQWPDSDLVVCAYALAELGPAARGRVVASAWRAATRALVLVEPGTPAGFERIHDARAALIDAGAHVLAPCPHDGPCPMRAAPVHDDWCHFAVRVPRSRRHRQLKGGSLGHEDEKFSYLAVSRRPEDGRAAARVLRHPRVEKGRIQVTLCTPDGLRRDVVTRRDPAWRAARKVEWGKTWPTSS